MRRDPYEVIGVAPARRSATSRRPSAASPRAAPDSTATTRGREKFKEAPRPTRSCPTPTGARSTTATASRASIRAAMPRRPTLRILLGHLRRLLRGDPFGAFGGRGAAGRGQGVTWPWRWRSRSKGPPGTAVEVAYDLVILRALWRQPGRAGIRVSYVQQLPGRRSCARRQPHGFRQLVREHVCSSCEGEGGSLCRPVAPARPGPARGPQDPRRGHTGRHRQRPAHPPLGAGAFRRPGWTRRRPLRAGAGGRG